VGMWTGLNSLRIRSSGGSSESSSFPYGPFGRSCRLQIQGRRISQTIKQKRV
jgi:hypothetical protein